MMMFLPPRPPVLSPIAPTADTPGVPLRIQLLFSQRPLPPPQTTESKAFRRAEFKPQTSKPSTTTPIEFCFIALLFLTRCFPSKCRPQEPPLPLAVEHAK